MDAPKIEHLLANGDLTLGKKLLLQHPMKIALHQIERYFDACLAGALSGEPITMGHRSKILNVGSFMWNELKNDPDRLVFIVCILGGLALISVTMMH